MTKKVGLGFVLVFVLVTSVTAFAGQVGTIRSAIAFATKEDCDAWLGLVREGKRKSDDQRASAEFAMQLIQAGRARQIKNLEVIVVEQPSWGGPCRVRSKANANSPSFWVLCGLIN